MHVHNHPTNFNAVSLSSPRAAEKAASAQQAIDVRRKLMEGGLDIEGEINPFESFMIGNEPESGSQQRHRQNQKSTHANTVKKPQLADKEQVDQPLSFWA